MIALKLARITRDPISAPALVEQLDTRHGGIVTFEGVVRRFSREKEIRFLEYDAFPEMAERQIAKILADAAVRWPETEVVAHHRIGRLEIGDVAVAILAASPHRAEAFEACRYVIDEIKERVPIWKKEVATDGETWIEGHG